MSGNHSQRDPFTGEDIDFLCGAVVAFPRCGCTVEGAGHLQDPVRIRFCPDHSIVDNTNKRTFVRLDPVDARDEYIDVNQENHPAIVGWRATDANNIVEIGPTPHDAWTRAAQAAYAQGYAAYEPILPMNASTRKLVDAFRAKAATSTTVKVPVPEEPFIRDANHVGATITHAVIRRYTDGRPDAAYVMWSDGLRSVGPSSNNEMKALLDRAEREGHPPTKERW